MNRRDALRSLMTLPVAATTIQRAPVQAVQGGHSAWDAPYGATVRIGWTDFTNGQKIYDPGDGYIPSIEKLLP